MIRHRHTVADVVEYNGLGLHSGVDVRVLIHPSEKGLFFRSGGSRVEAIAENVSDTLRCTKLGEISTIEHLMAAFAALAITDAEVELTTPELPAMGGGSAEFFTGILNVGLTQLTPNEIPDLFKRVFIQEGNVKIAIASGEGVWRFEFDSGDRYPGIQTYELTDFGDFGPEIAPARTFGWEEEVPAMIKAGMARGLDKNSALVISEAGYRNEALFDDEPVRHKLLDLIGDLYLAGVPVRNLSVVSEKSGHRTNVAAALKLRQALFA